MDAAVDLLRRSKVELASRWGVVRLALFGSTARGTARADSDVDLLVSFDGPATSERYFGVQFFLEDLLGRPGRSGDGQGVAAGVEERDRKGGGMDLMIEGAIVDFTIDREPTAAEAASLRRLAGLTLDQMSALAGYADSRAWWRIEADQRSCDRMRWQMLLLLTEHHPTHRLVKRR